MHEAVALVVLLVAVEQGESLRRHAPPEVLCQEACRVCDEYLHDLRLLREGSPCHRWPDIDSRTHETLRRRNVWWALWWVAWERSTPAQRVAWRDAVVEQVGEETWVRQQWPHPLP